jgi:predicted dehydrogenase
VPASSAVRVGVIGCGSIAVGVHLGALGRIEGARVTAVADPASEARERAVRLAPGAAALASAEELVGRDDVEGVVVSAPTRLHAALAILVLEARKHLYLEKPIATTLEDARRIVDEGRRAGVVAATGFNWRFQPLVVRARELLRAGALGDVRAAATAFCEPGAPPGWRHARADGGGVLLDLASHHVDLLRWLLETEVEHVDATLRSDVNEHDSAVVRLVLGGGRTALSYFSYRTGQVDTLELYGERGVLRTDRYARSLVLRAGRTHRRAGTPELAEWRRAGTEPSWKRSLEAWIDAIRGREVELATLDDGLRSLEVVLAAERSSTS